MEGYKNILIDGPPDEDGSYLLILKNETSVPRLFVRSTIADGSVQWVSMNRESISEDRIGLYKRILVTPETNKKNHVLW